MVGRVSLDEHVTKVVYEDLHIIYGQCGCCGHCTGNYMSSLVVNVAISDNFNIYLQSMNLDAMVNEEKMKTSILDKVSEKSGAVIEGINRDIPNSMKPLITNDEVIVDSLVGPTHGD
ncbi:hypothetical protein RJT34_19639 [Clitoria ternatea]|uniref:Uncharacterized protein n=1 Tax=Clitoria ternatea TaxID=43366 RepID=A0AAN9P400_CLITE